MPFTSLKELTNKQKASHWERLPNGAVTAIVNNKGNVVFTAITSDPVIKGRAANAYIAAILMNFESSKQTSVINFNKHHIVSVLNSDLFIAEFFYLPGTSHKNSWPTTKNATNFDDTSAAMEAIAIKRTELLLGVE